MWNGYRTYVPIFHSLLQRHVLGDMYLSCLYVLFCSDSLPLSPWLTSHLLHNMQVLLNSTYVGNKLMFLSEWREFPSALCLAGGWELDDSSRLDVVEIARFP